MFLGRALERARIARQLTAAREGRSGTLALVGESGIGKSALLDHARRGGGLRPRVIGARGMQSESDIPFAGLSELLVPVLGVVEAIPVAQAAALALGELPGMVQTGRRRAPRSGRARPPASSTLAPIIGENVKLDRPIAASSTLTVHERQRRLAGEAGRTPRSARFLPGRRWSTPDVELDLIRGASSTLTSTIADNVELGARASAARGP